MSPVRRTPNTTFAIKAGDTRPAIRGLISAESDDVVQSVRFLMKDGDGVLVIDGVGAVDEQPSLDEDTGESTGAVVSYQWASGETDPAGAFPAEFEVTFDDGRKETYPSQGFLTVLITEDLG